MQENQSVITFGGWSKTKAEITFRKALPDLIELIQGEHFVILDCHDLERLWEAYQEYKKANAAIYGGN